MITPFTNLPSEKKLTESAVKGKTRGCEEKHPHVDKESVGGVIGSAGREELLNGNRQSSQRRLACADVDQGWVWMDLNKVLAKIGSSASKFFDESVALDVVKI